MALPLRSPFPEVSGGDGEVETAVAVPQDYLQLALDSRVCVAEN
jgi:hypothetical protein